MRCLITLLAIAAAFTLAFSPTVRRALFASPKDLPATPADHVDRYMLGGRYVTKADWPLAESVPTEVG